MKQFFAVIGGGILGLIGILALTWVLVGNEFFLFQYFAPKRAAVEREVFENTPSYKFGNIQELENLKYNYEIARPEHKGALGDLFLRRAAQFGRDRLPSNLSQFAKQVETDRKNNFK